MDGVPISEEAVAMWTGRLLSPILERKATFFEATTALAFADFAARGAEIAVVEVGLGGRLDSTNVVRPLVSGVTKIERDHMKYLGDTLELIACEKAGIAKPGVPFVIGETDPGLVEVLRREARRAVPARGRGNAAARISGCCHRTTNGAVRSAWRDRISGATPRWRTASWRPCRRPIAPPRRRSSAPSACPGRRAARPPGPLAVRCGAQPGRNAVAGAAPWPRSGPLGRSTRWSRFWATRSGPRCWCSWTRSIDRGVLTIAPTAAARGLGHRVAAPLAADPARPPAHAEWTLVPEFPGGDREGAGGSGDGAGDRLVSHGWRRHVQALGMDVISLQR